ncbi:hypothetical protein GALMADRAFT_147513 [Galerina marginata CBS 339.88]|uniref:Uncharacterized protein n=1 Tax=Galerina marginata (strain CBS 339.88) TaxID=685588 RepID=A0A067S7M0_GALM3|nr:hypothetical protein GALMADRAFT_147513 [Galerina marginata CBS 339.88]
MRNGCNETEAFRAKDGRKLKRVKQATSGHAPEAYVAIPSTVKKPLALGFLAIKWDGQKTRLIVDSKSRLAAILVGQPEDPNPNLVTGGAAT